MTPQAGETIGLPHPSGVESGTVRVDASASLRMTLHAILLRMTRGARGEILPGGLSVLQRPQRYC